MLMQDIDSELAVEALIQKMGDDPARPGLEHTPRLVSEMMEELGRGYGQSEEEILDGAILDGIVTQSLVKVTDIEFYSLCEHHLLPFFGNCHVAYQPYKRVIGLGSIAAIVEMYARRLQIQERLTEQIADCLWRHLEPIGLSVRMEAQHLCMSMRGQKKGSARFETQVLRGEPLD